SHSIGCVHSSASTSSRASVADDTVIIFIGNRTSNFFTQCFKSRHDVQFFAFVIAGCNSSTVDHNRRAIESGHSHDRSGHILVTTWDRDYTIIVLSATDGLYAICNDITGYQRVAHTFCTIAHTVTHTDGAKGKTYQVIVPNTFFDHLCQIVEVHIAGITIVTHTSNTDLTFVHVGIGQSDTV